MRSSGPLANTQEKDGRMLSVLCGLRHRIFEVTDLPPDRVFAHRPIPQRHKFGPALWIHIYTLKKYFVKIGGR